MHQRILYKSHKLRNILKVKTTIQQTNTYKQQDIIRKYHGLPNISKEVLKAQRRNHTKEERMELN